MAAVGLGVGLLLTAVAGINAVNSQNARYAWFLTGNPGVLAGPVMTPASTSADPPWWLLRNDMFGGQVIRRVDVAATGPYSPVPPGVPHLPGPGEYYVSPALGKLLQASH